MSSAPARQEQLWSPPHSGMGRRPRQIDLAQVERLASQGLSDGPIGEAVGLSQRSMQQWVQQEHQREQESEGGYESALLTALKRGRSRWRARLLDRVEQYIDRGGKAGAPVLIFAAKQAHGLAWADERTIRGQVTHTHEAGDSMRQALRGLLEDRQHREAAIEAEYKVLTDQSDSGEGSTQ